MGALQPWHIVLVGVAFVVLFGAGRLPDAARGLGRSLRVFKSEMAELHEPSERQQPIGHDHEKP